VAANDAFLQIVGYTREDIDAGGLDWRMMTPPEYADLDEKALKELAARGECLPYEKNCIRKDGSQVTVLVGTARMQEEPPRFVCFVMDVTARKQAEAELVRLRSEFLGVISHELKTPLTAIKGSAAMGLSAEAPSQAEARELFEVINEQSERLRELIGNLLDATRIEAGTLAVNPTAEDLSDIVRAAVDTFGHAWQERPVQLTLTDLPPVMADRRRIHQVVSNLLSNAVKASPSREPVVVTVTVEGDRAVVRVKDFGRGIPRDKLPLLFHKFSQVHESGGRGTGLGLVISKGIVEAHGGSIWAESDGEGRGATFSFTLPIVLPQNAHAG
jgi:PAS domain S-box-containing protein